MTIGICSCSRSGVTAENMDELAGEVRESKLRFGEDDGVIAFSSRSFMFGL